MQAPTLISTRRSWWLDMVAQDQTVATGFVDYPNHHGLRGKGCK
jgi:hypothetical protein